MCSSPLGVEDCHDVLVVAITPRTSAGAVDPEGAKANARFLVERGVRFLMPMCGTGLVYDATLDEFEQVTAAFLEAAGDGARVVPGVGPGFGRALEMGAIARSLGAHGVMVMPIVGPASAKGVVRGLGRLADRLALPVVLYQRRLDIMPVADVIDLCRHPEVIALKYAVEDIDAFRRIVDGAGEAAAMVCGMAEDPSIEYLSEGAVGFSSGMANFVPRMSLALLDAFRCGDIPEAQRLRELMVPFEDFRGERGARYSAAALHVGMELSGLAGGPLIPFVEDVADEDRERVVDLMKILVAEEIRLGNPQPVGERG